MTDRLRALPSVDRLATAVARAELAERRAELLAGAGDEVDLVAGARERPAAFAAPSAQRDGRGRAHGSGPGAAWASRGGGLATIRASLSTRTLVAETIDDRLFAVEAQSSFIVIDTFDDGPELVESVSGWRGTQISSALARRVAAATPPIRVHQEVRLQLLRARAAAS